MDSFDNYFLKLVKSLNTSKNVNTTQKKLPPSPWKLPIIGNMHHMVGSVPHRVLRDLSSKHGPLMHLQLGEIYAVVISSPRLAKEVMKTHDLIFADRPKILASEILLYQPDIAFGPYGAHWRQMRKLCREKLLSHANVRSFCSVREEEAWGLVDSIDKSSGEPVNLNQKLYNLTSGITAKATVGKKCEDQELLIMMVKETTAMASGFNVADVFPSFKLIHVLSGEKPKMMKMHQQVDRVLENIINERRGRNKEYRETDQEEDNLLDVLLGLEKKGGLEFPITNHNTKAIIFDMFIGSSETSATTMEWAMAELMKNPRVMEKVQAELRQVLSGKKRIHESDLQELSYLNLVIKEALRLHPPGPLLVPRECRESCEIDGYTIPVKTKVIVNAWAIGRDPEYWPDAESFKPERFENNSIDFTGNNFEYIPFGAGRRMCPGLAFGLANIELALAHLLYHFDWKLPGGMKPEDLDMSETLGSAARMKNDLYLVATPFVHSS